MDERDGCEGGGQNLREEGEEAAARGEGEDGEGVEKKSEEKRNHRDGGEVVIFAHGGDEVVRLRGWTFWSNIYCLFILLSIYVFIYLFVHSIGYLNIYRFELFIYLFILFFCLFICSFDHLFASFICLLIYLFDCFLWFSS